MAYISKKLRKAVAERASFCCEYCLIPEQYSFFTYQIEHIRSKRHKGKNVSENLAYSCPICNRNKGTDLGTIINPPEITRFFNPRSDNWKEHFQLKKSGKIIPKTDIGEATISFFQFNHEDAILQRRKLIKAGGLELR